MEKSEIRALLEKLMAAFADTEDDKENAEDAAAEAAEEATEELEETPAEEAAEDAAEEVSEDLSEDSDDSPEEEAELEEEDAEEEKKSGTLTDEMKALIRTEMARLFKEMAKGSGRDVKEVDDATAQRLNKATGIYGPNNE